ncbi:MAG: hypothetical protein AAGA68_16630 [Pseudomonadota bacterium]
MIREAVVFGLLNSALISVLILLSFKHEPRLWLHHFPEQMQALVPAKTAAEKRLERRWGVPIIGCMIVLPLAVAMWRHQTHGFTYLDAYLFLWIATQTFNLMDLLVLDWLVTVRWSPPWMQLQGAESMKRYDNYWFHFVGFLKGLLIGSVGAAVIALPFLWL